VDIDEYLQALPPTYVKSDFVNDAPASVQRSFAAGGNKVIKAKIETELETKQMLQLMPIY